MIKDGFHGFAGKTEQFTAAVGAVSFEIRSRRIVIFFAVKLKRKPAVMRLNRRRPVWQKSKFPAHRVTLLNNACGRSFFSKHGAHKKDHILRDSADKL